MEARLAGVCHPCAFIMHRLVGSYVQVGEQLSTGLAGLRLGGKLVSDYVQAG